MPGVNAVNFTIPNCLGGGGLSSPRLDTYVVHQIYRVSEISINEVSLILTLPLWLMHTNNCLRTCWTGERDAQIFLSSLWVDVPLEEVVKVKL